MSEKIALSKVSKPSWPPPRGSVEVSQSGTSIDKKVAGISQAPTLSLIKVLSSHEGVNPIEPLFITTAIIFFSLLVDHPLNI